MYYCIVFYGVAAMALRGGYASILTSLSKEQVLILVVHLPVCCYNVLCAGGRLRSWKLLWPSGTIPLQSFAKKLPKR